MGKKMVGNNEREGKKVTFFSPPFRILQISAIVKTPFPPFLVDDDDETLEFDREQKKQLLTGRIKKTGHSHMDPKSQHQLKRVHKSQITVFVN